MDTVLVTGGAGFLGSHLCDKLLASGFKVVCADNLYTGTRKNIHHLKGNDNFKFIDVDITKKFQNTSKLLAILKTIRDLGGIKYIYNLACPASPKHYQKDPIYTFNTSVDGIKFLIEIAQYYSAKILQASTSEIYGDPISHPQKESDWGNVNPVGIRSCYDEGKRAAECIMYDYNRMKNVDVRTIRIFNTYGPRLNKDDGRVVSNFIVQALNNENITIYGDGSQTRSFCYVDDLLDGMVKLMNSNYIYPVNIGNPDEFTVKQLAEMVIELTDSKSEIIFQDLPKDDPTRRRPDISLAKKELNWEPKVKLKEGLLKTIEFFKK